MLLGNEHVDDTLRRGVPRSQLKQIAAALEGYSGSDMQDLCKQAALLPIHDYIEEARNAVLKHVFSSGTALLRRKAGTEQLQRPLLTLRDREYARKCCSTGLMYSW